IRPAAHAIRIALPASEGKLVYPVRVDLMRCVEIGGRSQLIRLPGIQHLACESAALEVVDSLGIRSDVDRFGVGVVQVELEAVCHAPTQAELASVVGAVANAVPAV